MHLVPEDLTRLQAFTFLTDAELARIGSEQTIRSAAQRMCEQALQKLLKDCVIKEARHGNLCGHMLSLDVYVMTPEELRAALAEARESGFCDAQRWRIPGLTESAGAISSEETR